MAKFQAPEHITEITLASGPVPVIDGVAEIHEPTSGDVSALYANGFTLIAEGSYFALPAEDAPPTKAKAAQPAEDAAPAADQPA